MSRIDIAQVGAQLRRRYGSVLPSLPAFRLAGNEDGRAECRLPHVPDARRFVGVCRCGRSEDPPLQPPRASAHHLRIRILRRPVPKLDEEKAPAFGGSSRTSSTARFSCSMKSTSMPSNPSSPIGLYSSTEGHCVRSKKRRRESQHHEPPMRRAVGQLQRRANDGRAGSFAAHQCARHVKAVLRQQFVEVVSGDAPRNARKSPPDQRRHTCRECAPVPHRFGRVFLCPR